jgi:hypothetical protein
MVDNLRRQGQSEQLNSTDFDEEASINNVIVSWWETNQSSFEPVIVLNGKRGATFGPILKLSNNGTIGTAAE